MKSLTAPTAKASDTPGDFVRRSRRIWSPAKMACDFLWRLMRTHLTIFFADRGDVVVLKTYVIKSSNLMGWLYWRLAAINVENRGNEFNHRYLTCSDFKRRSWRSAKIAIAAPGTPGDFIRRSRRIWSSFFAWCGHTWRFFSPIAAMWQFWKLMW